MSKSIVLFANTDWNLYNFRLSLAKALKQQGWKVVLLSPPGPYVARLEAAGFTHIACPFSTRSLNPFHELALLIRLIRIYRRIRPDIAHHFTIKSVIYGSLAARFTPGTSVANTVTGMGHIFTSKGLRATLARVAAKRLYTLALGGKHSRVIFQNDDDRRAFISLKLTNKQQSTVIRGSGVNTTLFSPATSPAPPNSPTKILFAGRLIAEKGIFEFVEAIKLLQTKGLSFEALVAGDLYPDNPSSLTQKSLAALTQSETFSYLGQIDDMAQLIRNIDIAVLPTYREGTPRFLLEAGACGKPLIATDIPGCQGVVIEGKNGFLVPIKNAEELANAMEKLVTDPLLIESMGIVSRKIICAGFSDDTVIKRVQEVYSSLS